MDVWEDTKTLAHRLKIERTLNFTTMPHEEDEYNYNQKKIARDPMSHRIIEKRRRDRMNNCLADLSRLIPSTYLKKGRGRIEKTEIIEMATKHLRHLQAHACKDPASCEVSLQQQQREEQHSRRVDDNHREENLLQKQREQHRLGFQECSSETIRFLVEVEGFYPGQGVCLRLLHHLQQHYEKLVQGVCYMGGDNHGDDREDATQSTMTNGQSTIMLPHQDDSNLLQLDSNSNQSLCESYQRQSTFNSNLGAAGHSRSLKRSSSQISDYPSNSEVLRLGQTPTERIGSLNVRSEEDMEEDHTRLAYYNNVTALERPVSVTSPRLLVQPGTSHPRSHLRDILNQDSCPASYEQKRFRSNSIDSTKSCRTTTGVIPSHLYHPADVFCNSRSAEEVYKFKNNIKERFRADVLHHNNFDDPNQPSNQDGMVAPAHDSYPKMPTSESFGISRMFPSTNGTQNERSFATLNGFGSFSVDNELAIKNQTETTPSNETMRPDIVTIRNGNPSSRSSSCGSNPSPHSLSSNCFTNQAGSSNNNKYNTSSADGNKNGSSSGLSSTSGYSTSGEGSSTISVRHKTTRKSSYSSGSPSSSRNNNGENSLINSSVEASNSLIPVFALHPKGTFYVPLTLDSSLLAPHLGDRQYLTDPEERLTLHPVNISVSFFHGRSNCKNRNEGTLMPPWKTKREPETSYDSYRERVY